MSHKQTLPYGSWPSPLSAELVARSGRRFGALASDGVSLYWTEGRPEEGGRCVLMRWQPDGVVEECLPGGYSVRSRVHEYGGGEFWVRDGELAFVNDGDQRLYLCRAGESPWALTPEPPTPRAWRYADGCFTPDGEALVCVRERHEPEGQVLNELIWLSLSDGSWRVLASGSDFYAAPRLAPDGRIAWICWNHPQMPWDGSELWQGWLDAAGRVHDAARVAGGPEVSVAYPAYGPDGRLYYASDRSGYYSLYVLDPDGIAEDLSPLPVEFAPPFWGLGYASFAFNERGQALALGYESGEGEAWLLEPETDHLLRLDLPYRAYGGGMAALGDSFAVLASSDTEPQALVLVDANGGASRVLRRSAEASVPVEAVAAAEALRFPHPSGHEVHAFYYAPKSPDYSGPDDEVPPLLVLSHSGPTGAATAGFNPQIAFWTSRGFAVVDVNYRGSTGYGRAYRDALKGRWGLADVEDCVHAAQMLAAQGMADPRRLLIRGGSAGGYTTLCAVVFHSIFAAGMSRYGVSDLESLVRDSHKFEAHYLDSLVAPYPTGAEIFRQRSPLYAADKLACPMLLLQGSEDTVVPPSQSERFAQVMEGKGIPHALLVFPGEGHGFRQAETIVCAMQAELAFYRRVLGVASKEVLPPLAIRHLDRSD